MQTPLHSYTNARIIKAMIFSVIDCFHYLFQCINGVKAERAKLILLSPDTEVGV